VSTRKQSTPIEFKEQVDQATNLLWLYASDEVLKALRLFFASDVDQIDRATLEKAYKSLLLAMRNDLKIKTNFGIMEIVPFRAT
jgi:hypothetical protein